MRRSCHRKRPKSHFVEGKIPRIWKMWEDSLEDAFVVIDTVLFVNQMKFGRISSAHCYGSI